MAQIRCDQNKRQLNKHEVDSKIATAPEVSPSQESQEYKLRAAAEEKCEQAQEKKAKN